MPTGPEDDHDNDRFAEEMRQYLHFARQPEDRVIAWKNTGISVNLTWTGGHQVNFDGRRIHPQKFILRHYLALSPEHAVRNTWSEGLIREVAHGWRKRATIVGAVSISTRSATGTHGRYYVGHPNHGGAVVYEAELPGFRRNEETAGAVDADHQA
jgi:hypothetical protein